jgi:hypothetical protein
MRQHLLAIVLRAWTMLHATPDETISDAIVSAVEQAHIFDQDLAAATMAVYSALESGNRMHPEAWSWDAKAGRACGPWQEPCAIVRQWSAARQARYWVRCVRSSSLASVDSSPSRARRRLELAVTAIEHVSVL